MTTTEPAPMPEPKQCEHAGCDALHANACEGDARFAGWRCYAHRMNFGEALVLLKSGRNVTRSLEDGWYVGLRSLLEPNRREQRVPPMLVRVTGAWYGSERLVPWEPTQEDVLAEDWLEWVDRLEWMDR
jgi:hypothetical protein